MSATITLEDSHTDGITAANAVMAEGHLQPEHFTNPGADSFWEDGANLGDAALQFFPDFSRHWKATKGQNYYEDENGRFVLVGEDWEDEHWDAFLGAFKDEARRLAKQRGWEWSVGDRESCVLPAVEEAQP